MLTTRRKTHLLDVLRRDGQIVAKDLARELGLSEDSIRRDLRELAAQGLLQRVHGGALPASPAVADLGTRATLSTDAKRAIGRAAAALVRPRQLVLLDGGTTALEVARALPPELDATIATHSPLVAAELARHPALEIVLIGGRLFRHSMVAVGAVAIEQIMRLRADLCLLGVTGVHAAHGLSTGDLEEAAVKRALVGASAETVVLASPEKLGAASPYVVAGLDAVGTVLTVRDADPARLRDLSAAGVEIAFA